MTLYELLSLYPAKIHLPSNNMRWTLEWTGAHLSNILMHECGIRSGGRSSIVSRPSPSYSRREQGSGKQRTIHGMHKCHDIIKRDVTNRKQFCAYILCASTVAKCPLLSRAWTSHCIHSLCTEINFARTTKQLICVIDGHVTTYCHFIGSHIVNLGTDSSLAQPDSYTLGGGGRESGKVW